MRSIGLVGVGIVLRHITPAVRTCHDSRAHGSDYNVRVKVFCVMFINSKATAIKTI